MKKPGPYSLGLRGGLDRHDEWAQLRCTTRLQRLGKKSQKCPMPDMTEGECSSSTRIGVGVT